GGDERDQLGAAVEHQRLLSGRLEQAGGEDQGVLREDVVTGARRGAIDIEVLHDDGVRHLVLDARRLLRWRRLGGAGGERRGGEGGRRAQRAARRGDAGEERGRARA